MPSAGTLIRDPFVSVAGFKAHPTSLDLQNLRSASSNAADQDAQLLSMLIEASGTAQNTICRQPLQGHIMTVNDRGRVNRRGELTIEALHGPVRRLLSLSYGTIRSQTTVTSPAYRVEDERLIVVDLGGSPTSWSGSLQLGAPASSQDLALTYSYVAAFCNTLLSAPAAVGATSVTMKDPTGLEPLDMFRLWDPGTEETLQVAASYVPAPSNPPVATVIPLVTPVANVHAGGVHVSGLPADAYEAVIYLAIDAIQRPGQGGGSSWPGAKNKSATAKQQQQQSAMYSRAVNLLRPYTARR